MALSLGVKRGARILIGGQLLIVKSILAANKILIQFGDKDALVTDLQRTELMPDAYVSAGQPDDGEDTPPVYTRLAFEAPRAIRIERIPDARAA
jgi:hypothetical protein